MLYPSIGDPIYDESGELVCTKPFPSMPTHFWNDEDGIKYQKAYFAMFKGNRISRSQPLCTTLSLYSKVIFNIISEVL